MFEDRRRLILVTLNPESSYRQGECGGRRKNPTPFIGCGDAMNWEEVATQLHEQVNVSCVQSFRFRS